MTAKFVIPKHLQPGTRRWLKNLQAEYLLEDHHGRIAILAGESWDRCVQAREAIARDGMTFRDDRGNIRPHPLLAVERDARTAFARLVRELDLDTEGPASPLRPPGLGSNRGR
jgi:phage terminase small subunit